MVGGGAGPHSSGNGPRLDRHRPVRQRLLWGLGGRGGRRGWQWLCRRHRRGFWLRERNRAGPSLPLLWLAVGSVNLPWLDRQRRERRRRIWRLGGRGRGRKRRWLCRRHRRGSRQWRESQRPGLSLYRFILWTGAQSSLGPDRRERQRRLWHHGRRGGRCQWRRLCRRHRRGAALRRPPRQSLYLLWACGRTDRRSALDRYGRERRRTLWFLSIRGRGCRW